MVVAEVDLISQEPFLPSVSIIYYPIVGMGPDLIVNRRHQGLKTARLKLCKVGGVNACSDY